jgi:uncharacterized membrane protein
MILAASQIQQYNSSALFLCTVSLMWSHVLGWGLGTLAEHEAVGIWNSPLVHMYEKTLTYWHSIDTSL